MSGNSVENFLYKKKAEILRSLEPCIEDCREMEATDQFENIQVNGTHGFQTKADSRIKLTLTGPDESREGNLFLEISERFRWPDFKQIYYRYELWWPYELLYERMRDDYCREVFLGLRRTLRFDHDEAHDPATHPVYHWHPNGSELRLPSPPMTPRRLALFAIRAFDLAKFEGMRANSATSADAVAIDRFFFPNDEG